MYDLWLYYEEDVVTRATCRLPMKFVHRSARPGFKIADQIKAGQGSSLFGSMGVPALKRCNYAMQSVMAEPTVAPTDLVRSLMTWAFSYEQLVP